MYQGILSPSMSTKRQWSVMCILTDASAAIHKHESQIDLSSNSAVVEDDTTATTLLHHNTALRGSTG